MHENSNLLYSIICILLFAIFTPVLLVAEVNTVSPASVRDDGDVPYSSNKFRVVVDPGHGGLAMQPSSIYGDKYDAITQKYTEAFRPGAVYNGVYEHEITYKIANGVKKYLDLTLDVSDHTAYKKLLSKYISNFSGELQPIKAYLSRSDSYFTDYKKHSVDPNASYRLYDYPNIHTHEREQARISRINALLPHLVVSIHMTMGKLSTNGLLHAVITPGLDTYLWALKYVQEIDKREEIFDIFHASAYAKWFLSINRNHFTSFLSDAHLYFTGYWGDSAGLHAELNQFKGYKHNMIDWSYQDNLNWEEEGRLHADNSRYSSDMRTLVLEGKFWKRERSQYEFFRREKGKENYGGDNLYASNEVLRYIRMGLLANRIDQMSSLPEIGKPYISVWSLPLYVNAVVAFVEIGYLDLKKDSDRVLKYSTIYSEAIAVAIYSLLFSLPHKAENKEFFLPWGEAIDYDKYSDYFSQVVMTTEESQIPGALSK